MTDHDHDWMYQYDEEPEATLGTRILAWTLIAASGTISVGLIYGICQAILWIIQ